tara:strand:- start:52 stop:1860 length:1809 start_codon:yes stop_codon:yes gene_type:complete
MANKVVDSNGSAKISSKVIKAKTHIQPGGAEKISYDPVNKHAWLITGEYNEKGGQVIVLDYSKGFKKKPKVIGEAFLKGDATDIAISSQGLAAATVVSPETAESKVTFFQLVGGKNPVKEVATTKVVGNLADQLVFTPDGNTLIVANEGQPLDFYGIEKKQYGIGTNPKGSIAIIDVDNKTPAKSDITTLEFKQSNKKLEKAGVRLSGPDKGDYKNFGIVDLEPEYVATSSDGEAIVALQENNGIAVVDIAKKKIKRVFGLEPKSFDGIPIDTNNEDEIFSPTEKKNLYGLSQPDGISSYVDTAGKLLYVSPGEGDGRIRPDDVNLEIESLIEDGLTDAFEGEKTFSYGSKDVGGAVFSDIDPWQEDAMIYIYDEAGVGNKGDFDVENDDELYVTLKHGANKDDDFYYDEVRSKDLEDEYSNVSKFDSAILAEGRLKTLKDMNDPKTGDLYMMGTRDFSIFDSKGKTLYHTGNMLEEIAASLNHYDDGRSDDKGTEPEHTVSFSMTNKKGKNERHLVAVGLERAFDQSSTADGGPPAGSIIPVFDVTDLKDVKHLATFWSPNAWSPEGIYYVPEKDHKGALLVASEMSGSVSTFPVSYSDLF